MPRKNNSNYDTNVEFRNLPAKVREKEKRRIEQEKFDRDREDAYWQETDKNTLKKLQRKEEREMKKVTSIEKKLEIKKLEVKENNEIDDSLSKKNTNKRLSAPRITQYEIEENKKTIGPVGRYSSIVNVESENGLSTNFNGTNGNCQKKLVYAGENQSYKTTISSNVVVLDPLQIVNSNKNEQNTINATNVDEALDAFMKIGLIDKSEVTNPATNSGSTKSSQLFKLYKEREFNRLKKEFPHLKYSQINQVIFKNWLKSPENPIYSSNQ